MKLFAIARTEHESGADWYVAPQGSGVDAHGMPNLDDPGVCVLEVSGVDVGLVGTRVREKKKQVIRGASNKPGLVAVVGFERAIVQIEPAK